VGFAQAEFTGGTVNFGTASFAADTVDFSGARFSGGRVDFSGARFSGGEVDFRDPSDWSFPPAFPWSDTPPPGAKLPEKGDQSQA